MPSIFNCPFLWGVSIPEKATGLEHCGQLTHTMEEGHNRYLSVSLWARQILYGILHSGSSAGDYLSNAYSKNFPIHPKLMYKPFWKTSGEL